MKRIYKILIAAAAVLLVLILLDLILLIPYRSKIPDLPDTNNLPAELKDQLTSGTRKARLNPSSFNLGILGMIYHSSADYDKAIVCYSLAEKKNSSKWIWNYYLGCLNKEMGESEKAINNFNIVVTENPKAWLAWFYLGELNLDLGHNDKADEALSRIDTLKKNTIPSNPVFRIDHFPLGTYGSYLHAKLKLNSNQMESSEKILREIITNSPDFGPAYRMLGSIYQTRGDSLLSKKFMAQANDNIYSTAPADTILDMISLRSRSELFILKQIDEASNNYYYEWAITLADHAMKYLPDNKYLISKTIKLLLNTNESVKTFPYLTEHLEKYKDDFFEIKQVADLLYEKKYYPQSRSYYKRALELQPENTEVQANLIFGLLNEGKDQLALEFLDGCLSKYGNNPGVVTNAVYIMLYLKNNEKAEYYFDMLKKLAPADNRTLLLSGYIAQQKGDLERACAQFEKSLNSPKKELLAAQALGEVLMKQKKWKSSINNFRQALEYFPNEPYIIEKLGSLLTMCPDSTQRNYIQGIEYLERVLNSMRSTQEIKINAGRSLAHAYMDQGNKTKASYYAFNTINLARNYNFPNEFIDDLKLMIY
jgi:tetratricopeptide (TPR) repeat protein